MASYPVFQRVSESLRFDGLQRTLADAQQRIARQEAIVATGERIRVPSDDPLGATRILALERAVRRGEGHLRNVEEGTGRLGAADGALSTIGDLLIRAKEILLAQSGDTATSQSRAHAAVEVSQLLEEMLAAANRTYAGRYLFAGTRTDEAPFRLQGETVAFRGDTEPGAVEVAPGLWVESSVSAFAAFGALSATVPSRIDLDPVLALDTKLRNLHGGAGIRAGAIEIRDGAGGSTVVDLSGAETVGDVLDLLNDDGFVQAELSLARTGIRLSKSGANLTVLDVDGGYTATDLGIAGTEMGASFDGSDLDPALRASTRLSLLRSGAGVDRTGLLIRNGSGEATIELAETDTVGELMEAIAASGAAVRARIASDGRGIEIVSELAGADLRVEENGGTSADDLGLITPPAELPLDRLNDGLGVDAIEGTDFTVALADGTLVAVDISDLATLGAVVDRMNAAGAGKLAASLVPGEARIQIQDLTTGPDPLRVRAENGSFAAANLAIEGEGTGGLLVGADLRPAGARVLGAFQAVLSMRDALEADDPEALHLLAAHLDEAHDRLLRSRADLGGRLARLEISRNRLEDEKVRLEETIAGDRGADLAETIAKYREELTLYQAVLAMASRSLSGTLLDYLR